VEKVEEGQSDVSRDSSRPNGMDNEILVEFVSMNSSTDRVKLLCIETSLESAFFSSLEVSVLDSRLMSSERVALIWNYVSQITSSIGEMSGSSREICFCCQENFELGS